MRAFFAIDLPVEVKKQIAEARDGLKHYLKNEFRRRKPLRWVEPENLHITLQFMAQLGEDDSDKLGQAVRTQLSGLKSFYLNMGPLEWFPSSYRPRVLSLKADPHEILAELSHVLGKEIEVLGYAIEDRPFRAHLTLARVDGLRDVDPLVLASFAWPVLPAMAVNEVVLFRSESHSGGSIYTPLARIKLAY